MKEFIPEIEQLVAQYQAEINDLNPARDGEEIEKKKIKQYTLIELKDFIKQDAFNNTKQLVQAAIDAALEKYKNEVRIDPEKINELDAKIKSGVLSTRTADILAKVENYQLPESLKKEHVEVKEIKQSFFQKQIQKDYQIRIGGDEKPVALFANRKFTLLLDNECVVRFHMRAFAGNKFTPKAKIFMVLSNSKNDDFNQLLLNLRKNETQKNVYWPDESLNILLLDNSAKILKKDIPQAAQNSFNIISVVDFSSRAAVYQLLTTVAKECLTMNQSSNDFTSLASISTFLQNPRP